MRYKPGYKEEKRKELLNLSGQLAKQHGFSATGVDAFMKEAGVTSGAFYSHFSSKNELFKALVEAELEQSLAMWRANPNDSADAWIDFELERYLGLNHLKRASKGCALPALASEIARADDEIKQVYQDRLLEGHTLFRKYLGSDEKAWAVMSQLVGAITLARAMADEAQQIAVLEACKSTVKDYLRLAKMAG